MWVKYLAWYLAHNGYLANGNLPYHHYPPPHHHHHLISSKKAHVSRLAIMVDRSLLPWRAINPGSTVTWLERFRWGHFSDARRWTKWPPISYHGENLLMKYPILFSSTFLASFFIFFICHLCPAQLCWLMNQSQGSQKEHINNHGPLSLVWGPVHRQLMFFYWQSPSLKEGVNFTQQQYHPNPHIFHFQGNVIFIINSKSRCGAK